MTARTNTCADCDAGLGWAIRFERRGRVRIAEFQTQSDMVVALEQLLFGTEAVEWVEFHTPIGECDG